MNGSTKLNFDRLTWWGIIAILLFVPLALGTVHHTSRAIFFLLTGATALFMAGAFNKSGARVYVDGFVLWMFVAMGALAWQLLPLGEARLGQWSPQSLSIHKLAAAFSGAAPMSTITLDRPETLLSFGHAAAYTLFYIVVFNFALRQSNAKKIAGLLAGLGIMAGAVGVLHLVTSADQFLWFYTPESGKAPQGFFTFLVNPNNAAALFNLSAFIFLGLGRTAVSARGRLSHTFLFVLAAAGTFATLSRGGIMALLVTMVLYHIGGSMSPAVEGEQNQFTSATFVLGLLLVAAMAALFVFGLDAMTHSLARNQFFTSWLEDTKLLAWLDALPLGFDFHNTGIGRGAFGQVFPVYNTVDPTVAFQGVENGALQMVLDFGVGTGTVLLGLMLLLALRRIIWGLGQALGIGMSCGVLAVGFQNLVDLSLSIPGVAVPTLATLATLSGLWRQKNRRKVLAYMRVGAIRWLFVAIPLALLPLIINNWYRTRSAATVEHKLEQFVAAAPLTPETNQEVLAYAGRALQEHPASFRIPLLVSGLLLRSGDHEGAWKWLRQASGRAPSSDKVKLARALLLRSQGRIPEAVAELRYYLARFPLDSQRVFSTMLAWRLNPEHSVAALGGEDPSLLAEYFIWLRTQDQDPLAEAILLHSITVHGRQEQLLGQLGFMYLSQRRLDLAEQRSTELMGLFPASPLGFLIQARIYSLKGNLEDSLALYDEARRRLEDNSMASLEMLSVLVRSRQWDRFEALATDVRRSVHNDPIKRARFHMVIASREMVRGKPYTALAELEKAEMATPLSSEIAIQKAQVFLSLEETDRAAAEFRKALKIDPDNSSAARGLSALEYVDTAR
jgi:tetratricopeptide (TPR) repeat protein